MTRLQALVGGSLALVLGLCAIALLAPLEGPGRGPSQGGQPAQSQAPQEGDPARGTRLGRGADRVGESSTPDSESARARDLVSVSEGRIGGLVRDEEGRALARVPIQLLQSGPETRDGATTTSDAQGRFWLDPQGEEGRAAILKVGGLRRPALHAQAWPGVPLVVVLPTGGSISGRVLDAEGRGIPAQVLARGGDWAEETLAGADGSFSFTSAPLGLVDLMARPGPRTGAIRGQSETIVEGGQSPGVTIRCPRGQTLRGRVETAQGQVAAGAELLIWPEVGSARDARRAICGSDGAFEISGLTPGELLLCARKGEQSEGPVPVLVPLGADPDPLEVRLQENAQPLGRVVDATGQALAGASLSLSRTGSKLSVTSQDSGDFAFPAAPSGDYELVVRKEGFVTLRDRVRFLPGGPRLWVELLQGASVTGRVLDPEGEPLEGARVEALAPDVRAVRTDAQGHFRLRGLPPGGVRVRASAKPHGAGVADVFLAPGQRADQDVVLVRPTAVSGLVSDGGGAPLADALVWVTGPGDERQGRSDAEGKFRVEGLGIGPFLVSATKAGYRPDQRDRIGPAGSVELFLEAVIPLRGQVRSLEGNPVHAVLVAPAEAPADAQLFEGSSFAILVGSETRQVIVRARAGPAHHGHGPSFLSPLYVTVPPGGGEVQVDLPPGEEAEGVILDAGGRPLPGVAVSFGHQREEVLGGESGRLYLLGISEDEGHFELAGIPPEGVRVTMSHPEHGPLVTQLLPGGDQSFRLPPGSVLSGQVVGPEGRPAEGVPLVIAGPVLRRVTSDAEGRYRAEGLAAGRYRVMRVDTEQSAETTLVPGQTAILDLRGQ